MSRTSVKSTGSVRKVVAATLVAALIATLAAIAPAPGLASAALAEDNSVIAWAAADDLWIANPDGTGVVNLTEDLAAEVWNEGDFEFTADGNTIVFGTAGAEEGAIPRVDDARYYSVNLLTMDITPLPGTGPYYTFGLSPDGDVIGLSDGTTLYTAPIDGSAPPSALDTGGMGARDPDWSPDGDRIAFNTPCCSTMEIYVINEDGSGDPVNISTSSEFQPSNVTWSPDGTKLAYEALFPFGVPDVSVNNIVVANADGSGGQVGVAPKVMSTDNRTPWFSPDGSKLVFVGSVDIGDSYDVLVAPSDGSSLPIVVSEDAAQWHSIDGRRNPWSPSGDRVIYGSNSPVGLWVANADASGDPVPIVPEPDAYDYRGDWSNDGTQAAVWLEFYPDDSSAERELPAFSTVYTTNADGTGGSVAISTATGAVEAGGLRSPPRELPDFPDVPEIHPFYEDIIWMVVNGITDGYADGEFKPDKNVTRMAMAAFLYRLAGEPACTPPASATFTDVPTDHPFFDEIEWLASTGITSGYPDGTYGTGRNVTRMAMAAFLYRLAGEPAFTPPASATFTDVPTDHPFFDEIEWLASTGITTGYPDGTFRPDRFITRMAMAAFLHRYADTFL